MFNSFKRKLPEISIFHRPSSPPSTKALNLLRSSLSSPYPPNNPSSPPLQFNLQVIESTPTPDQLNIILSYLSSSKSSSPPPSTVFISAHPSAPSLTDRPSTVKEIAKLGEKNPDALKWPIVVDWNEGKASVGDLDAVKGILETLRKRRDGELKDEDVYQPKGWFS